MGLDGCGQRKPEAVGATVSGSTMPTDGLVAVAVTPFDEGGMVDEPSLRSLMDFYIDCGSSGIALLGVMGEANRMTDDESKAVVGHATNAVDGRVPVIVGVSNSSLTRVADLGRFAMRSGCAGVLLQPLSGLQGDEAVADYFEAAAAAMGSGVPICVQDFPRANGVHLSLNAWRRIVTGCASVVMLKHEAEPGLTKLTKIREAEAAGLRRITILTGNNGILLPQELARGADGVMTGFAFPDVLARVTELAQAGRVEEASDLFDCFLPLNRYELSQGIALRKEILRRRGVIRTAAARYPPAAIDSTTAAELGGLLRRVEQVTNTSISEVQTYP
jgi:4-hydroxy-tetrahydrodipicolinate synthase